MASPNPIPKLIDEVELCAVLGCSRRKVQAMRQLGEGIPHIKIGASVRYAVPDVLAYLDRQRRRSTSDPGPQPNVAG